jgi:hypothetical protein
MLGRRRTLVIGALAGTGLALWVGPSADAQITCTGPGANQVCVETGQGRMRPDWPNNRLYVFVTGANGGPGTGAGLDLYCRSNGPGKPWAYHVGILNTSNGVEARTDSSTNVDCR